MKSKLKKLLLSSSMILSVVLCLSSCVTPYRFGNTLRAKEEKASDLSDYCDYRISDYVFPDGKVADVFIFNHTDDMIEWQFLQGRKYIVKYQVKDKYETKLDKFSRWFADLMDGRGSMDEYLYGWTPEGPLSPFYDAYFSLLTDSTVKDVKKVNESLKSNISVISYYTAEDLGRISDFMTSPNFGCSAYYEDEDGVYLLTICKPKAFSIYSSRILYKGIFSFPEEKRDEFAYMVVFIPKEMYEDKIINVAPAKTKPFNPYEVPDSGFSLMPTVKTRETVYYYDVNLADKLQWLAVKVACKGVYDTAYTGDFFLRNPFDYYRTSHIKSYLVANDGGSSRGTILFEGICFDYADFAYQEMNDNLREYSNVAGFWMVGTFDDSSDIVSYRIAKSGESSSMTINRTPVVVYGHNHIRAHENATNHAWLWIQSQDGTVYWIDPTWTDNTGKPVYGIVRGGVEIQLEPNAAYCVY